MHWGLWFWLCSITLPWATADLSASQPLEQWKPLDSGIVRKGPEMHDPKDSELLNQVLAFPDSTAIPMMVNRMLAEKANTMNRLWFVDMYHMWPKYDKVLQGFRVNVYKDNSCQYFDNIRGITADKIFTFDFARHLKVTGLATQFLIPLTVWEAQQWVAQQDSLGRLLVRIHFHIGERILAPCQPEEPSILWNQIQVVAYEFFPTPKTWGEKPKPQQRLGIYPLRERK